MIDEMNELLGPLLPLKIHKVDAHGMNLGLNGEGWGFSARSAWRVTRHGVVEIAGGQSEDFLLRMQKLCGLSILSIALQSPRMSGDLAIELTDGWWVEIFSDQPVDPWVMVIPGKTFVGSPSDPRFLA
ncbi:hypothetical protein [Arthrobacter sp. TWP1-1]|uniref:hypothetical protein n=1 Tax=Arthrobacter sp. TWP1-1 TaxID=2804568 RepID=UPI003CEC24DE